MNRAGIVVAMALVLAAIFVLGRYLILAYARYRDSRIITCPETREAALVEVDAMHAALTSLVGQPDIRLQNCWRWPLNENCGQECLTQLDVAPPECLVSGVLMKWYDSRICNYCSKPFEQIHWMDHRPALRSPQGRLVEWRDVPIEDIQTVISSYTPVCWDCYLAQSFRRDHPEMVVYRPWRAGVHQAGR
jgi:hypothetical protein